MLQANAESTELGGHIASYQSAETLYEVGFNHFWRARSEEHGGDLVYMQGHSSPGIYARAFLEGRLERGAAAPLPPGGRRRRALVVPAPVADARLLAVPDRLDGARAADGDLPGAVHEVPGRARESSTAGDRKVWAFMGDGEMDEPESMGAISLAGREKLDNLVFVVNCNLQRLDGPVRGNGKIIQELETNFRGAGWNVIKVIWGSGWDPLLEADDGRLAPLPLMEECVDGEYQTFKAKDGAYVREHFFGKYPETRAMVADWTRRARSGRSAAAATTRRRSMPPTPPPSATRGQPTVILAKTIKGYGMGVAGEGRNITHQQKAMNEEARLAIRDRLGLAAHRRGGDRRVLPPPARRTAPSCSYLARAPRRELGGSLPARHADGGAAPDARRRSRPCSRAAASARTRPRWRSSASSTRSCATRRSGQRIVPIVPDESRTFGMEGMFRQLGIFSQVGQLYQPEDAEDFMFYREDQHGQILQEGINEPGAFSSWIAAATVYANHGVAMVPVLHLLLDVRLPAGRRPRLGGRRQPRARLPDRRDRRAHDAERRGAPARGRALAPPRVGRSRTAAPTTRPTPTSSP